MLEQAIGGIAVFGATTQAVLTIRLYEPPERDDGTQPTPVFEAVLFFVLFAIGFGLAGYVLAFVAFSVPPYTQLLLLLVTAVGFYAAYAALKGVSDRDRMTELMGAVSSLTIGLFPVVFLVLYPPLL